MNDVYQYDVINKVIIDLTKSLEEIKVITAKVGRPNTRVNAEFRTLFIRKAEKKVPPRVVRPLRPYPPPRA